MNNKKNLYYQHRGGEVTVLEFLSNKSTIFYNPINPISIGEFLGFVSDSGVSNLTSIKLAYVTNDEKRKMGNSGSLKIKNNTQLVLPKSRATKTIQHPQNPITLSKDWDLSFKSSVLAALEKQRGYKLLHPQRLSSIGSGTLTQRVVKASAWIWVRSLGVDNYEDGWFDLSPFILVQTTNVSNNGGNFSISLPPLTCRYEGNKWVLKREELKYYTNNIGEISYYASSNFFTEELNTTSNVFPTTIDGIKSLKRSKFFFHTILSPNDLVYIKFDTLELESSSRVVNLNSNPLSSKNLVGQVFDMIGLVDSCTIKTDINKTITVVTTITGRDLVKPLIEDGTYFFPTEYTNGGYKKLYFSSGSITQLSIPLFRKVKDIINFFIKNLSNIKVVPDQLLSSYGEGKGIWKMISLIVDPLVDKRVVVDSSISVAQGSLLNHFRKICQEPFVEFFSDTYFDRYFLTVRVPPFTQKMLGNIINGQFRDEKGQMQYLDAPFITVQESSIVSETLSFQDNDVYTWFYLVPKEIVGGLSQDVWASIFPPKIFPELVEIFGSKPLQVTHSYLSYTIDLENEKPKVTKTVKEQGLEDLKFLIETHVHLPFTRSGSITIVGDRRIKRGQYIYYQPTNELFYVQGVQHSYNASNLQSTTTIQVDRGMVVDYILGKSVPGYSKKISYFNLVNLDNVEVYKEEDETVTTSKEEKVKRTRSVDIPNLDGSEVDTSKIKTKSSRVDLTEVNINLLTYLTTLPDSLLDKVVVTSANDSQHMSGSKHYSGNAVDLRYDKDLYDYIKRDPNRESYGIEPPPNPNHGTGPHIHLEMYNSRLSGSTTESSSMEEVYYETEVTTQTILTGRKIKVLNVQKSLDNINVNKEVLNFFLKKLQFNG